MEAQQTADFAQLFTNYGPYGLLAILFFCVAHLYKAQTALSTEVRQTVEKYAADLAKLQEQTLAAIQSNTDALNRLREEWKRSERD